MLLYVNYDQSCNANNDIHNLQYESQHKKVFGLQEILVFIHQNTLEWIIDI